MAEWLARYVSKRYKVTATQSHVCPSSQQQVHSSQEVWSVLQMSVKIDTDRGPSAQWKITHFKAEWSSHEICNVDEWKAWHRHSSQSQKPPWCLTTSASMSRIGWSRDRRGISESDGVWEGVRETAAGAGLPRDRNAWRFWYLAVSGPDAVPVLGDVLHACGSQRITSETARLLLEIGSLAWSGAQGLS